MPLDTVSTKNSSLAHEIKHVWFDVNGTLIPDTPEYTAAYNTLRYSAYAQAIVRPISSELISEFEELYRQLGTNSAVFRSLGLPDEYWQHKFSTLKKEEFYKPNKSIYGTLDILRTKVPISVFTNVNLEEFYRTLKIVSIDPSWLTAVISGDDCKERKPALDGFNLIVNRSNLSPSSILYIGDRLKADILPAKQVGLKTAMMWASCPDADYSFEQFEDILSIF
jgi:FMN phosphatase YigB (HAD superfamily)